VDIEYNPLYNFLSKAGPSKACNQPQGAKLSQQQKNAIVAKHNELRSKVALGQASLPQAANMRKMVYNFIFVNFLYNH